MSLCEMCGKEAQLVSADVERVELKLCSGCVKYGVIKNKSGVSSSGFRVGSSSPVKLKPIKSEGPQLKVIDEFAFLIRSAREKRGMTQEDFAKFLNEKVSILAKWEQGSLKPSIGWAQKIGKILSLNLVEKDEAGDVDIKKTKSDEFTLADFVKVRKRK